MTLPTANIRMDYAGNGSTVTFPYTYKAFANTDLRVLLTEDATGVSVTQTLTTHYTVSGVGSESGGNVVMVTAPPVGYTLTILATIANTQTTDLVNETRFYQSRIEDRMDKLCRADQVQAEKQSRSMVLPESEAGDPTLTTLPPLAERKGKTQAYDAITGAPVMFSTASTAVSSVMEPVLQANTLALARSAIGIGGIFDVTDPTYGAVGDGVTDDTIAIQATVDSLPANGGVVMIPPGTFKITSAISTNGKNVWFKGSGKIATTISQATVGSNIHAINFTGATQYLMVSDMSIVTATDLTADNGQCAIRADIGANGSAVDNSEVHVWNCRLSGFNLGCYVAGKNASASAKFSIASVRNCQIRHRGANSSSVSEAVCHHHVRLSVIEDSAMDAIGGNGDHSIYCYTPRHAIHRRNEMSNTAGEAVKILTNATAGEMAPYAWCVDDNTFTSCLAACYITTDGAYVLPLATFRNNAVITDGGGGTALYSVIFSALATSKIKNIIVDGDSFQDCQKGLVLFQAEASAFIESAHVDKVHAYNWSIASAGTYSAIVDSGPGTLRSITASGYFDGNSNGRQAFNLSVFGQVAYRPSTQVNCTATFYPGTSVELGSTRTNLSAMAVRHIEANTNVGTPASIVETALKTITIAANSLAKTGQGVRIRVWGSTAANANTKTIRLKYGSTTLLTNGVTTAPNGVYWEFEAMVFRTSGSFIAHFGKGQVGTALQNPNHSVSVSKDNTAAQDIVLTGQNGTASANEIVCYGMLVEYLA